MNRSGHVVWFKVFVLGGLFTVVKNVGFFSRGFVFRTSTGMSSSLEPLSRDKGLFCSFWEVFYELYGKFMMMIDVFVSLFWELNKVVLSSTIAL